MHNKNLPFSKDCEFVQSFSNFIVVFKFCSGQFKN